ncbi:MAG: radical SAM protein [Eubacteriaceae bacterium]|jgi:23S rRNA (adenine2503-C2)-methyltransferase|nr:radical SAM protein [Eubacteriaceae bacterium]
MEICKNLVSMTPNELKEACRQRGEAPYRAAQIQSWLRKGAQIAEMSDLPEKFRQNLQKDFTSFALELEKTVWDSKSGAKKYLYLCNDDIIIEGVNLAYRYGDAQCISTQAGCSMHCVFCASGKNGLKRNLSWQEMLSQLLIAQRDICPKIANIVLMGSGEPLDNYDQTKIFLEKLTSADEYGYSRRRVTLSTCGVVPGIRKMIADRLFVNLAISLHAPYHELRLRLMPVEKSYPLNALLEAARDYWVLGGRRVTYEYSVVEGLNDTELCASELEKITNSGGSQINLIDINEGGSFRANSKQAVGKFSEKLARRGVPHTIRRSLGSGINAACGQLSGYSQKP